ncbi:helix-turn-helix domain-containing protein [Alteriqipengyuania lutimaris]|uniref:Chromosomal replication initiator DnaA C-terminal domain-containing protein n=1 Tax=Alteriqipengyuania lutimaris TaxID=1538146 RepID=A0A395LQS6_9SPHN|nr:helix-turn-helix domain-containing protein [Alteriqipengyuania lutimaris]MBB3034034.1 hypothetical protein [Alteriqipengyuania lutimaris]RDS77020.1 hypothetical protein DL238_04945 [Alteriqipengyuania lutimaris]
MSKSWLDNWTPGAKHRAVIAYVAEIHHLEPAMLLGRSRTWNLGVPRFICCWVLRNLFPDLSYPMIGRVMAGRDHSTIIYAIQKVEKRRDACETFRRQTDAILEAARPYAARGQSAAFSPERLDEIALRAFGGAKTATQSVSQNEVSDDEARVLAAIQADVDAEADALLARVAQSEADKA